MKAKIVAIVGVDGSGKSTLAVSVASLLSRSGVPTSVLHLSEFKGIPGWEKFSNNFIARWKCAERPNRLMLIFLAICSALIYPFAKRKTERSGIQCILVEHHPRFDFPVFGRIYTGILGEIITRLVIWLWKKPDLIVHINVSDEKARQNIRCRRKNKPYHERQLSKTRQLIERELTYYQSDRVVLYTFPANQDSCAEYILEFFWEIEHESVLCF